MLFQSLNTPQPDSSIFLSCRNILTDFEIWPISKSPVLGFCVWALNPVTWCWKEEHTWCGLAWLLQWRAQCLSSFNGYIEWSLGTDLSHFVFYSDIWSQNWFRMTKGYLLLNICLTAQTVSPNSNHFLLSVFDGMQLILANSCTLCCGLWFGQRTFSLY